MSLWLISRESCWKKFILCASGNISLALYFYCTLYSKDLSLSVDLLRGKFYWIWFESRLWLLEWECKDLTSYLIKCFFQLCIILPWEFWQIKHSLPPYTPHSLFKLFPWLMSGWYAMSDHVFINQLKAQSGKEKKKAQSAFICIILMDPHKS